MDKKCCSKAAMAHEGAKKGKGAKGASMLKKPDFADKMSARYEAKRDGSKR